MTAERIGRTQESLTRLRLRAVRTCLAKAHSAMLAVLAIVASSSCVTTDAADKAPMERDIAVLRAVLQKEACGRADQKYQVVSDRPAPATSVSVPKTWRSSAALNEELARRSEEALSWTHIDVCSAVRIVEGSKIEAIFAADDRIPPGWDSFENAFPGASRLIEVSLPAFTSDGKRAVVYLDTKCGVLCGAGFYIELKRTAAGWQVTQRETAWIS
jgi:hypothetical protein